MRGERRLLRLGEYLVGRACQRLPADIRQERYREWAAELPAILHDPEVRPAPRRAVRMLGFAADTVRGTAVTPRATRARISRIFGAGDLLVIAAGLVTAAWHTWLIVQAPGNVEDYLQLAWSVLLAAYLIRKRVRPAGRATELLLVSATLALGATFLGNAAQAPGDWVNYFLGALFILPLLVGIPLAWWLRRLQARTGGRHAAPSDPRAFLS
jgi:hypothetical protein